MVRIRDISNVIPGHYFRSSMTNFNVGSTKLIQPSDLDSLNLDNLKSIDAPSIQLEAGDLLLSNRGKIRAVIMPISGKFVFPSSIYAIRLKSKKYIPEFVSAYINSEIGQVQLLAASSGSYISNLTKNALENFELPKISLEQQIKIAEIDSDLAKYRSITADKANLIESIKNNLIKELV